MPSRKMLFIGLMVIALFLKMWWLFFPMVGFCIGYTVRREKDRRDAVK